VRRIELALGVAPSHYEPGQTPPRAGRPAEPEHDGPERQEAVSL
jgi:hypothetical protein